MAETARENKKSLRDVLRTIFRRKTLFLLGSLLCAIVILLGSHLMPLKYTGTITFERRSDVVTGQKAEGEAFETYKSTMKFQLCGEKAIKQAIKDLQLDRGFTRSSDGQLTEAGQRAEQGLVQKLSEKLNMTWDARTEQIDLISLSFTDADPTLAQQLPNMLVTNYIAQIGELMVARLGESKKFLEQQVANGQSKLTDQTDSKLKFELKHAGMMPDRPGAIQEQINRISSDIDTIRKQKTVAESKVARLKSRRQTPDGPSTQPVQVIRGNNPDYLRLREQLQQARDQLDIAVSVSKMTEEHPTIKTMRVKIAHLEAELGNTPRVTTQQEIYGAAPTEKADLAAELDAAQAEAETFANEEQRYQARLASYENLMKDFGPISQDYMRLVKDVNDQQAEVGRWQQRLDEVRMTLSAEAAKRRTHLNPVQLADRQFFPSSPKLLMILVAAIFGGLAFGAGLVFLANLLDRSVNTTEEATRHFDLPVHGVIAEIVTPRQQWVRRTKVWTVGPAVTAIVLLALLWSGLSVTFRLKYPEEDYARWREAPVRFLIEWATGNRETAKKTSRATTQQAS